MEIYSRYKRKFNESRVNYTHGDIVKCIKDYTLDSIMQDFHIYKGEIYELNNLTADLATWVLYPIKGSTIEKRNNKKEVYVLDLPKYFKIIKN